jgi:hypothetical protein
MSSKPGRNKPCPCGSGVKYKKCCMATDQARESEALRARAAEADRLAPASSLLVGADQISAARREGRVDLEQRVQTELAALSTEQLLVRLRELGIETAQEDFVALSRTKDTAWAVGEEVWLADAAEDIDPRRRELVCLAACELWQRWLPDQPSAATRLEWLERGYERVRGYDPAGACDVWLRLWAWMRPLLTPLMREMDRDADGLLGGDYFMLNWTQDLCEALHDAALDDTTYVAPGIGFCEQVIAQFTEEHDTVDHFRCDLADLLVLADQRERAEAILGDLIERRPHEAIGYVRLADVVTLRSDDPADRLRAISLLEQALARPVRDPADWDVETRLDDMRVSLDEAR